MSYKKLISKPNLLLAWRRLTTTKDARYKQFFRHIYEAYELSYEANIRNLRRRLRDKVYIPHEPVRIYYPKASGLQRPVTLLSVEDQILLQALANMFAEKLRERRTPLIGKAIFSNWLTRKGDSEFFLSDWKFGYKSLRTRLIFLYDQGFHWVINFDLSAFYETIPHDLLLKTIFPRGGAARFVEEASSWLRVWSTDERSAQHGHGIPQGPKASDFLAECIMLPIDERMGKSFIYLRYVDDIRILGRTELEVRQALVYLDILCRERGLIPSSEKSEIKKVSSSKELVRDMPDIQEYSDYGGQQITEPKVINKLLSEAINKDEEHIEIVDRSKLRFILFRAAASESALEIVLRLWKRTPQHIDAFVVFLDNYERQYAVIEICKELLKERYPYDFVRGEMWKLLARMGLSDEIHPLIELAIDTVKNVKKGSAARVGAYAFLCKCESMGMGAYSRWVMYEKSSIIQAMVSPYINISAESCLDVVIIMLSRSLPDPSLALTRNLMNAGITIDQLDKSRDDLPPVVQNVYHVAGILPGKPKYRMDPIGNILANRYSIHKWDYWKTIFGGEYQHALMLLTLAEAYFGSHLSAWLSQQDAFNDALFRSFQAFLSSKGAAGAVPTIDAQGLLIDFGNMIRHGNFTRIYPALAGQLQAVHDRRNQLPSSHPYEKKTGAKAKPLRKGEQRNLVARLRVVYSEIMHIAQGLGS